MTEAQMIDPLYYIRLHGLEIEELLQGLLNFRASEVLEVVQSAEDETLTQTDIINLCDDSMSQSNVALAMRNLKRAGVVDAVQVGKFKNYSINSARIEQINRITNQLANG